MRIRTFTRRSATPARIAGLAAVLLLFTFLYLPARPARAGVAVGTSAGGFLGFEVGASSAGLAGANTSVASGASAQFWNPSLLAGTAQPQVSIMHATWLENLQYEWIGYARPLGPKLGTGSVSVAYFHMPSLAGVDQFDNPTGEFRVYDMAITFGLARPVAKGINVGANAKLIRQTLATVSGTGAAVDLGASTRIAGTSVGLTMQNLGPDISLGGGSYSLPRQIRLGASHEFLADRLMLAADYNLPQTYYNDLRIGAEIRPHPMIAARIGYRHEFGVRDDPATGLSYGLGAHVGPVNVDYAMTPDNDFSDVHRLSFGYTFGGAQEKPEPIRPEPKQRPAPQPPVPKGPPVIAAVPEPKAPAPIVAPPPAKAAPEPQPAPAAPQQPAREMYEVVLGTYQSEASARAELKALQILGFSVKDAQITLEPGRGYKLSLARLGSKKSANDLAASLTRLSFTASVEIARP
ncbi:MAG: SPOR domain-containing protein [Candidatus Eisenbacteria bacterium]|uniref:SPOR domain-containing protein n=1 Tax=Eiseniibacteriota bacterium TaxID=2212470 RepID=A0A538T2M5_UNCEI|nr:MAG: SPOR domain-containing protein [Candidatus Eisenbacteria bacterium]